MQQSFEEKLIARIATAQTLHNQQADIDMEALLDNASFINVQRSIYAKDKELSKLNTVIRQLNSIKPFITNDGTRYSITVYPVGMFGVGIGEVFGIINGSRSAFTDELAMQYSAITGISMIEFIEAREALGSPCYFTRDGQVVDAIPANYPKLVPLLNSIFIKMGIREFDLSSVTKDRIDLWFTKAELSVAKKASEFNKNVLLDSNNSFTMED